MLKMATNNARTCGIAGWIRVLAWGLIIGLAGSPAAAQEFPKNIMTGGPKGTYIQIGRDLAAASAQCGQTLQVNESAGSLENLVAVKKRLHTQFAIVQSDVLEYVRTYSANDADLRRSLFGVRIMFPLYNEEIHILASRDIQSLSDLAGRRVAIGKRDSGTFLTATLVLDIMRINDANRLAIGAADAMPQLMAGEIDALFYVSGAPTSLFKDNTIDGANFHLLNITEPKLLATYSPAQIPAGTYPFQPEAVEGVAVKAVLMTYDYSPSKGAYHSNSCKAVSDVASIMLSNLAQFRQDGHPKWKDVDLAELPPGWEVGDCVKRGMRPNYKLACAPTASQAIEADADQEYLNLLKERLTE